ncbi:sodium:proton antiporter [Pediococcus argentinicus]|uniref:cation:proton antiporter n=1 Tax=Pediococcus argentinicus TaxID=480391 RepID=UPI00338DD55D
MEIVLAVLTLIIAVIISNVIATKISFIPQAIIQIGMGLILSLIPTAYQHFSLDPKLFMVAIIAPLMFYDGANTNINKIRHSLTNTFSLAIGLALLTIVIVGFITHQLIPGLPIALAFALGAIITPTDAVAVSSVTQNLEVPSEAMNTLKNESLFNDASGIVAFDIALLTFQTGHFSAWFSIADYIYVFFGGLVFGMILGYLVTRTQSFLIEHQIDNPNIVVPINLITPFAIYLIAEELGTSGILAVVAAGLVQGAMQKQLRLTSTSIQIVTKTTWEVLSSTMDGFVFVLLGAALPTVVSNILHLTRNVASIGSLILIGLLLYVVMTLLRYLWVTFRLASIRFKPEARRFNNFLIALNGIHGTITLSMAFSLPLLSHSMNFPYRNDLIFIAAVVIITSILVPTILLPILLPTKSLSYSVDDIDKYRKQMIRYAANKIEEVDEDPIETQAVIATLYSQQSATRSPKRRQLLRLFNDCNNLENGIVQDMVDNGDLTTQQQSMYQRLIFSQSSRIENTVFQNLALRLKFNILKRWHRLRHPSVSIYTLNPEMKKKYLNGKQQLADIEDQVSPKIFDYLSEIVNANNRDSVRWLERYYRQRHRRFQFGSTSDEIQDELFISAFQHEYNFVQNLLSKGTISKDLAGLLYEQISNDELVYMQNDGIYI